MGKLNPKRLCRCNDSHELGRSVAAVQVRAKKQKLMRSNPISSKSGEDNNPIVLQRSSSRARLIVRGYLHEIGPL